MGKAFSEEKVQEIRTVIREKLKETNRPKRNVLAKQLGISRKTVDHYIQQERLNTNPVQATSDEIRAILNGPWR